MPSSRDLPDPGIKPQAITSLALAGGFFPTSTTWEAPLSMTKHHNYIDFDLFFNFLYDLKYQLLGISTIISAFLHVYTSLVHLQLLCHSDVCDILCHCVS